MRRAIIGITVGLTAVAGAGGSAPAATPGADVRPHDSARVTNRWFPLRPGTRWTYTGREGGRPARDIVRVAQRVRIVGGIRCAVVLDRLYRSGRLVERTTDWYAQDARGRVLYEGEATAELDAHGRVTTTEGSWRAGRHGARGGVFMPVRPRAGQSFEQEHAPGVAEDRFSVVTRRATARVPYGTFRRSALRTRETTPLEPGVVDRKLYVRGIGQVVEASVKGGHDRLVLSRFRRGG